MIIAYVDDSETERNRALPLFLKEFQNYNIPVHRFDFFESGEAFLESWKQGTYDLIILDIFMGGLTGVEVANKVRAQNKDVRIVFCSTSNEFANESYDVNACYYIQKPISEKAVAQMISRLNIEDYELRRFILLPDGQKLILRNMIYADYNNHQIEIHMKKGTNLKIRMSFSAFCSLLSDFDFFLACNSGSVLNLWEVAEIRSDLFVMIDGTSIPISRRKKNDVHSQYETFLLHSIREDL